MKKCDIIIPIYNSPEWVNICVYALMHNTQNENIGKVYLVNDCSNDITVNCINNLQNKYSDKIVVLNNKVNGGFIKSVNNGFKNSKSDYVLLLNTDCIITKNTIEKLMGHMEKDKNIGLICPISSNAANLTLDMFDGFTFHQMNDLLERKFKGKLFDACTVVGNCLMISRDCIEKVGYLDEAYGTGYGEETDYQFKAMEKGFTAKVAIDTYVFHKSEVSFGTSKEKQERLQKNRDLFFSRWKEQYDKEMEKYEKNDPISYIHENLTEDDKKINVDTIFYLNGIVQNAGGVHVVVDIVNNMAIHGKSFNIVYDMMSEYKEIMLFNPIARPKLENANIGQIVSTIYASTYSAKVIADEKKIPLIAFVQGNETYFENGAVYGITELSYKLADDILVISKYLQNELKNTFNHDSTLISNSIKYDLLHKENKNKKVKTISFILRNTPMKGDWLILDIIKKISNKFNNLNVNVVYMNQYIEFPNIENKTIKLNKILGPISRSEVTKILQETDLFVDASLSEGFGLMALEAIACGAVPIVSDSRGVLQYMKNGKNGYVVDKVNNSDSFIEKIEKVINDVELYQSMKEECKKTAKEFDADKYIEDYIKFFDKKRKKKTDIKFTEQEQLIINAMTRRVTYEGNSKRKIYKIAKFIPKGIKRRLKKIITILYSCFEH